MSQTIKQSTNPYQKLYRRELSDFELTEIQHNLVSFFDVLIKLDQLDKEQGNEQNKRSSNSTN